MAASISNNAIENENRYSVSPTLDYVPDLSNSKAGRPKGGNPSREGGTTFEMGWVPQPFRRSGGTDVPEARSGGESAHRPSSQHVNDPDQSQDQR